jgi:hypothetical protein
MRLIRPAHTGTVPHGEGRECTVELHEGPARVRFCVYKAADIDASPIVWAGDIDQETRELVPISVPQNVVAGRGVARSTAEAHWTI